MADEPEAGAKTRDGLSLPGEPEALLKLIEQRRARLAATLDELTARTRPQELARRGAAGVAARGRAAVRTEDGGWRVERIAAVALAAVAVVAAVAAVVGVRRRRR